MTMTTRARQTVRNRLVVAPAPPRMTTDELNERLTSTRSKTFTVHHAVVADVPRRRVVIVDCEYTAVGADTRDLRSFVSKAVGCDIANVDAPMQGEYVPA